MYRVLKPGGKLFIGEVSDIDKKEITENLRAKSDDQREKHRVSQKKVDHLYYPVSFFKEIEKAFQIANEANFNEEELELQYRKRDWIYIQKSSIELASKTGREEGKLVERKQIAIKMHQANVDIEVISQVTGLSVEEIKTLVQT